MTIAEFKELVGDPQGNFPELVCDEYCRYPDIIHAEGWTEDAFFDQLNYRYCDDCPINKLFVEGDD